MKTKNNFGIFSEMLEAYFKERGAGFSFISSLKACSCNYGSTEPGYLYKGNTDLAVISMDEIADKGYKKIMNVSGNNPKDNLNSVDAFLINSGNDWFFIEFKDTDIDKKKTKDNIEKKGMANWLMLQDIFNGIGADGCKEMIDLSNLSEFARTHITYIVVCSREKNAEIYGKIRDCEKVNERYTPDCLKKFKNYFFKDAYAYTENYFEKRFVEKFEY